MKTRSLYLLTVVGGVLAWWLGTPQPLSGQNPVFSARDKALEEAIFQLAQQNKQLAENQAQIDAQIATLGEAIRQTRIVVARSGRRGGTQ